MVFESPIRDHFLIVCGTTFIGLIVGVFFGLRYLNNVRIPFYKEYFPEEYEFYKKNNDRKYGYRFISRSFEDSFRNAFLAFGIMLGNILAYII